MTCGLLGCEGSGTDDGSPSPPEPTPAGELAGLADERADVYIEFLVRPDEQTMEYAGDLLRKLGSGPAGAEGFRDRFIEGISRTLPLSEAPEWDRDIAPWAGDRAAIFGEVSDRGIVNSISDRPESAVAVTVADPALAEETLVRLADEGLEREEREGTIAFAADRNGAVALTEDVLVLGEVRAVEHAIDPETAKLDEEPDFKRALRDVDIPRDEGELGFAITDNGTQIEQDFVDGLGAAARFFGDDPLAELGVDIDQPLVFELAVSRLEAVLEFSVAPTAGPRIREVRDLAEQTPGDAAVILGDPLITPFYADSFLTGLETGLEREIGDVPTEQVVAGIGYDPFAVLGALSGDYALHATSVKEGVAFGATVSTSGQGDGGLDLVDLVALSYEPDATLTDYDPGGGGAGVTSDTPVFGLDLAAAEYGDRLEIALGTSPEVARDAVAPRRERSNPYLFDSLDSDLGGDFTAVGFADLPSLTYFLSLLAPDGDLAVLRNKQGGELAVGAAYERKRLSLRLEVVPPKLPRGGALENELEASPSPTTEASLRGPEGLPDDSVVAALP